MSNTYTCAMCNNEYTKGWSDEDAAKELGENFSGFTAEDCEIVCDGCYKKFMGSDDDTAARLREVEAELETARSVMVMLMLCGEQECCDVINPADKLRALIDGVIEWRNNFEALSDLRKSDAIYMREAESRATAAEQERDALRLALADLVADCSDDAGDWPALKCAETALNALAPLRIGAGMSATKRRVRCTLCTTYRWMGNSKGRRPAEISSHRDRQKIKNQIVAELA